jgi:hypothetical protein
VLATKNIANMFPNRICMLTNFITRLATMSNAFFVRELQLRAPASAGVSGLIP